MEAFLCLPNVLLTDNNYLSIILYRVQRVCLKANTKGPLCAQLNPCTSVFKPEPSHWLKPEQSHLSLIL